MLGISDTLVTRYFLRGTSHSSLVLDATDARDSFAVGFLAGMLDGKEPDASVRLGDCEALLSLKCSVRQGEPPLAHAAGILQRTLLK